MPKQLSKNSRCASQRPLPNTQKTLQPTRSRISLNETPQDSHPIKVKCSGANPAKQFCLSPNCSHQLRWTCFNQDCKCLVEHQDCKMSSIHSAFKKIQLKIIDPSEPLKQQIRHVFNSIISEFTSTRDNLLKSVDLEKQRLKEINLSEIEKRFVKEVQKNDKKQIFSATETKQVWTLLNQQNSKPINYSQPLMEELKKFDDSSKNTQTGLVDFFKAVLNSPQISTQKPAIRENQQIQILLNTPNKQFFSDSAIVKNLADRNTLVGLLSQEKKFKSALMAYRGSEHNFSMKQFFEICGRTQNLVILCETMMGKIIGGFSPLSHEYTNKGRKDFLENEPVADHSKSSFIFSVSNKQKFSLTKPSFAVYRFKTKTNIQFGQGQLKIGQYADKNTNSCTEINNGVYQNENYRARQLESYKRFNGGEEAEVLLREWEAWVIDFDEGGLVEKNDFN